MQIVLFYIYTEDIDWKFLLCNYPMRYHAGAWERETLRTFASFAVK